MTFGDEPPTGAIESAFWLWWWAVRLPLWLGSELVFAACFSLICLSKSSLCCLFLASPSCHWAISFSPQCIVLM